MRLCYQYYFYWTLVHVKLVLVAYNIQYNLAHNTISIKEKANPTVLH